MDHNELTDILAHISWSALTDPGFVPEGLVFQTSLFCVCGERGNRLLSSSLEIGHPVTELTLGVLGQSQQREAAGICILRTVRVTSKLARNRLGFLQVVDVSLTPSPFNSYWNTVLLSKAQRSLFIGICVILDCADGGSRCRSPSVVLTSICVYRLSF